MVEGSRGSSAATDLQLKGADDAKPVFESKCVTLPRSQSGAAGW